MKRITFFILTIGLLLASSCTPSEGVIPVAGDVTCHGSFREDRLDLKLKLSPAEAESLSTYVDVAPTTGGNRVIIYFKLDPKDQGADYALFVYRDLWILTTYHKKKGWYNVQLHFQRFDMPISKENTEVSLSIDLNLFDAPPKKIWNVMRNSPVS
ncbi:MAG: hypothetical protein ACFFCW_32715 [Candidatus Hodarchaeota archaeon]